MSSTLLVSRQLNCSPSICSPDWPPVLKIPETSWTISLQNPTSGTSTLPFLWYTAEQEMQSRFSASIPRSWVGGSFQRLSLLLWNSEGLFFSFVFLHSYLGLLQAFPDNRTILLPFVLLIDHQSHSPKHPGPFPCRIQPVALSFLWTRCTIKVENALFKWKLRMLLISENWSRAQPIKSFPSTLRFQLETVLSFHQLERADYWVKTTCLARINHRLQICIYVEFLAVITY